MKKDIRNKKGITLVALVITIILLLILAGITISQLTGSGLFEKAKLAKQESRNAQQKEEAILGDYQNKIGEYINNDRASSNVTSIIDEIFLIKYNYETVAASTDILLYDTKNVKTINIAFTEIQSGTVTIYGIKDDDSETAICSWVAGSNADIGERNVSIQNENNEYKKIKINWLKPINYINSGLRGSIERIFN